MDRFSELRAFYLVANSGGFSAAARQLKLATSSVTRLVDTLERRLGTPLLNRSTRGLTLTDVGREYYLRAGEILASLDEADDVATGHANMARGTLRVAAPVSFAIKFIAPLIPDLQQRYPQLVLDLRLSDSVTNLVDESIDVAIRIGNVEQQPALIARKLAAHTRSICASVAYLERNGTPTSPSDLATHNCLQFSYGNKRQTWRLRSAGRIDEVEVRGFLNANNSEVLRRVALDGIGLVLLPDWQISEDVEAGRLVRVMENYEANPGDMNIGIYAVYPANRRGSHKLKCFVDVLATALQGVIVPHVLPEPCDHTDEIEKTMLMK